MRVASAGGTDRDAMCRRSAAEVNSRVVEELITGQILLVRDVRIVSCLKRLTWRIFRSMLKSRTHIICRSVCCRMTLVTCTHRGLFRDEIFWSACSRQLVHMGI